MPSEREQRSGEPDQQRQREQSECAATVAGWSRALKALFMLSVLLAGTA